MPKEKLSKIIELNEDLIENNENLAAQNKEIFLKYNIKSYCKEGNADHCNII